MKKLLPFFVLASTAFAPLAQAQHSKDSATSGVHRQHQGRAMHTMKMGMSGMKTLKGLSGKKFNIAFLSQMVEHHQGALDMAQQTLKVAKHAETKTEAQMVITDQKKEIKQMTDWLQKWYGVKPSQAQKNLVKADMKSMMAMKVSSDRMFFEMMIPHHQGAIEMSRLALRQTDRAEVKQLAQHIIKAQKAEISRYNGLLPHVK
jgi:uncharacterized protein (DUF305 family)